MYIPSKSVKKPKVHNPKDLLHLRAKMWTRETKETKCAGHHLCYHH